MHGIARPDLEAMLQQLDQAVHNHGKWYEAVMRILVCRLPFDPRYVSPDAHRECAFGLWYYKHASEKLRAHPSFIAVEAQHREMHELASSLLNEGKGGGQVAAADYDHFNARMAQFRLELETLQKELEAALGNLDPLTGAYNRVGMLTGLRAQQELVKRKVLSCCVAMVDIDHFKRINDQYGHLAGDSVLAGVSRYLIGHVRPYDKVYRYGGEEFLLCLPGIDLAAAHGLVDRLRQGVADHPARVDGKTIPCRVSCGVALLEATGPVARIIERADKAMYAAKSAGRDRTCTWEPSLG